jgi:hypothetical protein
MGPITEKIMGIIVYSMAKSAECSLLSSIPGRSPFWLSKHESKNLLVIMKAAQG